MRFAQASKGAGLLLEDKKLVANEVPSQTDDTTHGSANEASLGDGKCTGR